MKNITKRPIIKNQESADNANAFIAAAPDADTAKKGVVRGKKEQISYAISPDILKQVDTLAVEKGVSRAALISIAIAEYLKRERN